MGSVQGPVSCAAQPIRQMKRIHLPGVLAWSSLNKSKHEEHSHCSPSWSHLAQMQKAKWGVREPLRSWESDSGEGGSQSHQGPHPKIVTHTIKIMAKALKCQIPSTFKKSYSWTHTHTKTSKYLKTWKSWTTHCSAICGQLFVSSQYPRVKLWLPLCQPFLPWVPGWLSCFVMRVWVISSMNRLALEFKSDSIRLKDQRQSPEDLMRCMGSAWRPHMEVRHGGPRFTGWTWVAIESQAAHRPLEFHSTGNGMEIKTL